VLTAVTDHSSRRLLTAVEAVGLAWLVTLPALRPLVWSGQPTDVANLFYLVLLAAAIVTGLLQRGLSAPAVDDCPVVWWRRPWLWGLVFLLAAAVGGWNSPYLAAAWTLIVGWTLHVAAPLALWPLLRRHPHLVMAGLVAGLVGEGLLMIGQALVERPHLAAQLAQNQVLTVEQRTADQYQARIGGWRLEGTFLLANTLGTYLIMLVPLVWSIAWRQRAAESSKGWIISAIVVMALIALGMTGSKAGMLALLLAMVVTAGLHRDVGHWRKRALGLTALLGLAAVIAAVFIPQVRSALVASAEVRLDYWRAGMALVAERPLTGHGLEGFAQQYPRVKLPSGEETVFAHQEMLQAAVDLGVPAMVVLLGWWWWILHSLRGSSMVASPPLSAKRLPHSTLVIMPLLLVFAGSVAGVLSATFTVYPWGLPWLWTIIMAGILTWIAKYAATLPLPSTAACWCAVLACLVHVQADFSLHSMQVVGVLAWVVALGQGVARGQADRQPAIASHTSELGSPRRQGCFAVAGLLVLCAVAFGVMASAERGQVLERAREAEAILARMRLAEAGRLSDQQRVAVWEALDETVSRVVVEDGRAALADDPREVLALTMIRRAVEGSRRFPADHDLVFVAIALGEHVQALMPERATVLTPMLESLVAEWPGDLLVIKALSEHYLRLARGATSDEQRRLARQAQSFALRAVDGYPTHLPLRQTVISAAELTGDQNTVATQQAEIARLTPLVHRDNRAR
jgi:O-antigen ligase